MHKYLRFVNQSSMYQVWNKWLCHKIIRYQNKFLTHSHCFATNSRSNRINIWKIRWDQKLSNLFKNRPVEFYEDEKILLIGTKLYTPTKIVNSFGSFLFFMNQYREVWVPMTSIRIKFWNFKNISHKRIFIQRESCKHPKSCQANQIWLSMLIILKN